MEPTLSTVGTAIIIVILLLREIRPFVSKGYNKSNGKESVSGCVLRSEFNDHKKVVQYKDNCDKTLKMIDVQFQVLNEYNAQRREYLKDEFFKIGEQFREVKSLIKNGST